MTKNRKDLNNMPNNQTVFGKYTLYVNLLYTCE